MAKLIEITGKAISGEWGNDDETGNGIPVLRTTNFTNIGVINFSNVVTRDIRKRNISDKFLRNGDIIIEKSGGSDTQPVGRVIFFEAEDNKYLFNNFTGLLRVIDKNVCFPKYLFYVLFNNYQRGGTIPFQNKTTGLHNLKIDDYVKSCDIPLPNIETQKQIAANLDKVTHTIDLCNTILEKLDLLVKSLFIELFGDPVSNPMKWGTKSLLSIGKCKNGMNFHYDDSGVEIHCLGVGDFKDLSIITDTTILPKISLNEMPNDEYLLQNDDIVFVRSNGNKALVGRSLAIYPNDTPTTFSGFCIRFRKDDDSIIVPYLLRVLKTDSIRKKMAGRGANIQNLNQQILSTLEIPIPPLALQEQFAAFVEQTDKSKLAVKQVLEKAETLKKALMQEYFG